MPHLDTNATPAGARSPSALRRAIARAERTLERDNVSVAQVDALLARLNRLFEAAVAAIGEGGTPDPVLGRLAIAAARAMLQAHTVRASLLGVDAADTLERVLTVANEIGADLWPEEYRPVEPGGDG